MLKSVDTKIWLLKVQMLRVVYVVALAKMKQNLQMSEDASSYRLFLTRLKLIRTSTSTEWFYLV